MMEKKRPTEVPGERAGNLYRDCDDNKTVAIETTNGVVFFIDKADEDKVRQYVWYCCTSRSGMKTIMNSRGLALHSFLIDTPKGMEIDHIDLDRMNNRRENLRVVTHQQNQCNQPQQSNNTSGVTGVRFYKRLRKYVARIKVKQHEIHLGYYDTFDEAVQARNVGMECMFGQYGRYDIDTTDVPDRIRDKVIGICRRFADVSVGKVFLCEAQV